jgi:hypothetical protein
MAKVYGKSQYSIGIKRKAIDNSSIFLKSDAATDTAYQLLPVINVSAPVLNLIESGEIRSNNAGMIETNLDQFRSKKGAFVTLDFELPAEREGIVRLLSNVLQDHTQTGSGPYVHTIQATSGSPLTRPDFDALDSADSTTDGIPSVFDIALYGPAANQDKLITSAVLQNLTMNFDMTDGRLLLSGSFYSGFVNSGFKVGQNLTGGSSAATLMHTDPTEIESYFNTKTLDIAGSATNAVITGVSFTFENNLARVGRDENGDAENYAFGVPSVNITGEISLMYDDNFHDGAANVVQDFLNGTPATLILQQGDGTVGTAGEMNITAEIYSTAVNYDLNADTGAIITIPFKVIQPTASGAVSGTAFKFEYADNKSYTSW